MVNKSSKTTILTTINDYSRKALFPPKCAELIFTDKTQIDDNYQLVRFFYQEMAALFCKIIKSAGSALHVVWSYGYPNNIDRSWGYIFLPDK